MSLNHIKTAILSNEMTKDNLREAAKLFKSLYSATKNSAIGNIKNNRSIGATGRGGPRSPFYSNRNNNNKGRGSGFARGGRGFNRGTNRGGRGGRSYNRGNQNRRSDDQYYIDNNVLKHLSPFHQRMMFMGRDAMKEQNNSTDRNIGAQSQQHDSTNEPTTTNNMLQQNNSASEQFGRQGRSLQNRSSGCGRTQGAITITNKRKVNKTSVIEQTTIDPNGRYRLEIDSRADTACCGKGWRVHSYTGQIVDVSGFHDSFQTIKDVPIATCYCAFDHPEGYTVTLFVHEALYFGDTMEHSLIPPAQIWNNGLICDITPKHVSNGQSIFGIYDPSTQIHLSFNLYGCIAYLPIRYCIDNELDNNDAIYLTSDAPWDPYSDTFIQQEKPFQTQQSFEINNDYCHATYDFNGNRVIRATSSKDHRSTVDAHTLAWQWGTTKDVAEHTLKVTTQRGIRFNVKPYLSRRFRTRQAQLGFTWLKGPVFSDTLFSDTKSIRGNTCAQIFVTDKEYSTIYPLKSKSEAFVALNEFCHNIGLPNPIITDNAGEETDGEWERVRKKYLLTQRTTEPYSPWQNKAESEIRELKKHFRRIMHRSKTPEALWCYGLEYASEIRSLMAKHNLDNRTPTEFLTGDTPDISEYLEYDFHGWIKYWDPNAKQPGEQLGKWLGVAKNQGQAMVYYILKDNCYVISRSTIRNLTKEEWLDEKESDERKQFDKTEYETLGDFDGSLIMEESNDEMAEPTKEHADDDSIDDLSEDMNKNDKVNTVDEMHGAEMYLPHGDRTEIAKVLGRKRDNDGNFIGRKHQNPILDSRVYVVEFSDGDQQEISFNVLAEHLFSQVDEEGNMTKLFKGIVGHRRKQNAIDKADQYRYVNGRKIKKKTTTGWDIEIEWVDGTTSWLPMKEVKATNSIELAQYAVENKIDHEPAFDWWVKPTLKRKRRLIKLSKMRHKKSGYKFGIRVPQSIEEALELDRLNNNDLWYQAIKKELEKVRVVFKLLDKGEKHSTGYQFVSLKMIFDVKMDFTRKARLVAGGHMTETPSSITYSSVVSRDSIRIIFLVAALNDLNILMSDIGNAYLNANPREKIYSIAGKEFGPEDEGKTVIIVRALYGLKSSGAAWRSHFAQSLRDLGFESCLADPDVWRRSAVKKDGSKYYEYVLVYVDNQLTVSENPQEIINALKGEPFKYEMKDIGEPTRYLGATIGKYELEDFVTWYISAEDYLEKAIPNIEERFGKLETLFPKSKLGAPASSDYHPEIDETTQLDDDTTSLYQSYIGILRWAVEISRIDLAHTAATMAKFMASPRAGHLIGLLKAFAYVKQHMRSKLVIDPFVRDWSQLNWSNENWQEFYPDAKEAIPPNMPEPRGKAVQINLFVDSAHASCLVSRRSTSGIVIFVNGTPVKWFSKRQNTIESSTFGSEFVAAKIAVELNESLRYKLRMFGIPIEGPTNGFCDNAGLIKNVTRPESTLQKKHNSIAYHKV